MANSASGILYRKFPTETKNDFKVREFVLYQPGEYPNFLKFQLTGTNTELIDSMAEGWAVKVDYNIKGRKYEKDGKEQFFNSLTAWRITVESMVKDKNITTPTEETDEVEFTEF